jgi:RHS repeat-associated protein
MPPEAITRQPVEIFGRHLGYGFAGLDVSTAIGNFTQTTTDLGFPASLLGLLDWQRTYNSHSGAIGALGPGWTTSFSASLVVSPPEGLLHHTPGPVTFHDEDGRILTFTPDPAGGFTRPQDLNASLTQNADGSYALAYNSGQVWSFDSTGRLTGRAQDGQQVTLAYDGQDLLVSATHSSGRHLAFSYDANRRLTGVAADDGRTASFTYSAGTVTDALLETASVPGGGVYRYESSGSGQASQVSRITDPDGNLIVANSYDAQTTRVTSQQFPGGSGATFAYDDATGVTTVTFTPSGTQVLFQADANGRLTKVTDPDGNAATFSYDSRGYLATATTPGGTQLTQTRDDNGNLATSEFGGATTTWTYDASNRITSSTDPAGARTDYTYTGDSHVPTGITDAIGAHTTRTVVNGLITASTDAEGHTTLLGYDSGGNLVSVTDPAGQVTSFGYDAAGNRTTVTTPSGATCQWTFDAQQQVTAYTDPAGATTTFRYSAAGLLLATTDPTDATTQFSYDVAGNQTAVTDPLGQTFSYGYDAAGNRTSITDPAGGVTQFGYDAFGRLTSVTDPVGGVTTIEYDANGNSVAQHDPSGTWTTSFDARGNPVAATDPAGATTHYAYDLADRLTGITDPEGGSWTIEHDAVGMPVAITDPAGTTARQAWTPVGRLASATDALGRRITLTRDTVGRVTQVTDASGGATTFAYDADGRRISVTTPAGLAARAEYDAAGRIVASVDYRGWITRSEYNARGQKIAQISPSGVITRYRYDAAGRLTVAVDGEGNETQYGYDPAGRLISVTDAKGGVSRFGYDAAGRETSDTDPLGRTTRRAYDAAGNMITFTDPSGHAQHLSYDADHRLIRWTADDGTEISYAYDKLGRRTSMTDVTGTTHYSYDPNGNPLTITEPDGSVFTARYDKAGQRTALTYPDGLQVTYTYDVKGQLVGLQDSRGGSAAYALDPDGRLITEQLPGRMERRYHYDHGLLRRFAVVRDGHQVAATVFGHDPDGRVTSQRGEGRRREYRYDRLGQLVSARHWEARAQPEPGDHRPPDERGRGERWRERDALHLTYDAIGNRTALEHGGLHTHYRYDEASQLVASETDGRRTEYRYDTSGRLTEQVSGPDRDVIEYDGLGRPIRVTRSRGPLSLRQAATFNGDGLTTALALTSADDRREEQHAASVRYQWSRDEIPDILTQRTELELDDTEREHRGRPDADFTYGYGRVFASSEHRVEAFHIDAFGSTVRTEETRDWAQAASYDLFGAPEPEPHDAPRDHEPHEPELPRFGYRGELALGPRLDLRARTYDAGLGRFITRDPLDARATGPGNGANPYAYAGNDPLDRTDALGLLVVPPPGDYVSPFRTVPPAVKPAAGRRTSAQGTIHLTAQMLAGGEGGDYASLHNLAVDTAETALAAQLGAPWDDFHNEVPVEDAGKNGAKNGSVDLAYVLGRSAQLWEIKSSTHQGSEAASNALARDETADYVMYWNIKPPASLPGTRARPGVGLLKQVPIPGIYTDDPEPIQWYVYSYNPTLPEGAVLYGPKEPPSHPWPPPIPVRAPETKRVPKPQQPPWWSRLEPWHWRLPTLPPIAPPTPQQNAAAGSSAVVAVALVVVLVLAF